MGIRLSIRARLSLTLMFLSVALAAIGYTNHHFQQRLLGDVDLRDSLEEMHSTLLTLRRAEKDFLAHHQESFRQAFLNGYDRLVKQRDALARNLSRSDMDNSGIEAIRLPLEAYREAFLAVHEKQALIGLNYAEGQYAALRDSARQVEAVVARDPVLLAALRRLRGYEKDFMLSRNALYAKDFATAIAEFRSLLFLSDIDNALKADVQRALNDYYQHFQVLVQNEIDIGLNLESGLVGLMTNQVEEVERRFDVLRTGLDSTLSGNIERSRLLSSVIIAGVMAAAIFMLLHTSRRIVTSLRRAQQDVALLGNGHWDTPISIMHRDEVGAVLEALESMRVELLSSTSRLAADNALKDRQAALAKVLQGIKDPHTLAADAIGHLARTLDCQVGALYLWKPEEELLFSAGYGLTHAEPCLAPGETLLGQAVLNRKATIVRDVPPGYLTVSSGTGSSTAATLLLVPLVWNGELYGGIELGSLGAVSDAALHFLSHAGEAIAISLHAAQAREETTRLLERARFQADQLRQEQHASVAANTRLEAQAASLKASEMKLQLQQEELQAQQEELRVTNEELEAQSRLLHERTRELERRNREMEAMLQRQVATS